MSRRCAPYIRRVRPDDRPRRGANEVQGVSPVTGIWKGPRVRHGQRWGCAWECIGRQRWDADWNGKKEHWEGAKHGQQVPLPVKTRDSLVRSAAHRPGPAARPHSVCVNRLVHGMLHLRRRARVPFRISSPSLAVLLASLANFCLRDNRDSTSWASKARKNV